MTLQNNTHSATTSFTTTFNAAILSLAHVTIFLLFPPQIERKTTSIREYEE